MARKRTGQLICRKGWFYARVTTVIDGEKVRVMKALGTQNPVVARKKLDKLNAAESPATEDVKRAETFAEAAERVYAERVAEVEATDPLRARGTREELAQLRRQALPLIGKMSVLAVSASDVNSVLDEAKKAGLSRQSVVHLKQRISNVFATIKREPGGRHDNPVDDATMPKFPETVTKERSVLSDAELAIYLAWEHPKERFGHAVLERQTMACVARMFGGLRTGDLHALRWESFDVEAGGFKWGYAPRQKTRRPQLLEVPEMLRPILRAWWHRSGTPQQGIVFPVSRAGKHGDRIGEERRGASHAKGFRRDLQSAFGAAIGRGETAPSKGSRRWQELFQETAYTLPIDFHSWRRAYAQALADADVTAQQASALAGHADLGAHARYLRNAEKMRVMPAAALPRLEFRQRALAKGSDAFSGRITGSAREAEIIDPAYLESDQRIPKPLVGGSNPPGSAEKRGIELEQKALAMPKPAEATPIPARPAVRLLDVLAAIDAAVIAGDAHAARALVAEAVRLERERMATGSNEASPVGAADLSE